METIQVRWILVVSILCPAINCQASRHRKRRQSKVERNGLKQWLQRVGVLHPLRNKLLNKKLSKNNSKRRDNQHVKIRFDNNQLLRKRNNSLNKKLRKAISFRKLLQVVPIERPLLHSNQRKKRMPPSLTAPVVAVVVVTIAAAQ